MNEQLFSTYWYRVANLKPFLRNTTIISRHVYREEPWYVLKNSLNGHSHRFNAPAYALIGQMDGQRTVEEIWENAGHLSADATPTQDEFIRLLGHLHNADLVQSDILPSTMEVVQKSRTDQNNKLKQRAANPFSIRFPLFDPDRFLEKWQFIPALAFTLPAFIIWLIVVTAALGAAVVYGTDLVNSISDRLFNTNTLLMLWLTYPLVKLLHEFGHAWAVKKWGGEIHEMGIKLIAFTPIPYVDASASAAFSEKRHRIMVAAMGMMIELLLASIALFVWLNVETGFVSAAAYSVMMVSGISTLLFNGNPLLRYDGYYILSDLIEIPNLAQRSTRYLGYLIQRYIFRIETAESPATARGEETWCLIYGLISSCYRIMIMLWLIWMFSERFFFVGIIIAIWGVISLLILPAFRKLTYFLSLPAIKSKHLQVVTFGTGAVIGIGLLLFVFPMPFWTTAQGVVWLPEQSAIRPGIDCEIVEVVAPIDQAVKKDTLLLSGVDPFLESEIDVFSAQLEELYASYHAHSLQKRVERKLILEEIQRIKGDLEQVKEKQKHLQVSSPARGHFTLLDTRSLPGRFVKKGELLGYIIPVNQSTTVRAAVQQTDIDLVRNQVTRVEVRLAEQSEKLLPARVNRIVPAADFNLPSAALGTGYGGNIPVDPTDPKGLRALATIFQVDITLPDDINNPRVGGRAYIRFEHGTLPLAMQVYRKLRQVFLRKFHV